MTIIFLSGPSGVGKTSVLRKLSNLYECYLENSSQNPELKLLLQGSSSFNAYKSQLWFLERINDFIQKSKAEIVFVDQNPKAIMNVYSKYFLDTEKICTDDYNRLDNYYNQLTKNINDKYSCVIDYYLFADVEILEQRAGQRDSEKLSWFQEISNNFALLYRNDPSITFVNTNSMSLEEVSKFIENSVSVNIKINADNFFLDNIFDESIRDAKSVSGLNITYAVELMYGKIINLAVSKKKQCELFDILKEKYKENFIHTATSVHDFYSNIDEAFFKVADKSGGKYEINTSL